MNEKFNIKIKRAPGKKNRDKRGKNKRQMYKFSAFPIKIPACFMQKLKSSF